MRRMTVSILVSATCCLAQAAEWAVTMNLVDAAGGAMPIGSITISQSNYGLVFTPSLEGLPPGVHGFHVHENGSCQPALRDGQAVAALAAGGHYDPLGAKRHGTPWGDGHLGDLPGLVVDAAGRSTYPVLAPRLEPDDIRSRSLMIHLGGDNHADHPQPLGGGGARIACGVIGP